MIQFKKDKRRDSRWTDWSILAFGCTLASFRLSTEDEYNTADFYFSLLNFSCWSMMTFEFGIDADLGVDGGRIAVRLPFLMLCLATLPVLDPHHKTWRTKRG